MKEKSRTFDESANTISHLRFRVAEAEGIQELQTKSNKELYLEVSVTPKKTNSSVAMLVENKIRQKLPELLNEIKEDLCQEITQLEDRLSKTLGDTLGV